MALKVLSRTKFKHNIWLQIFENYEVQRLLVAKMLLRSSETRDKHKLNICAIGIPLSPI